MIKNPLCLPVLSVLIFISQSALAIKPVDSGKAQATALTINQNAGILAQVKGQERQQVPYQLKVIPPRLVKPIVKPTIESWFDVPLGPLKPGTKLYLKGKNFDPQPGKILMYGKFPNSPIELHDIQWMGNESVSGMVPQFMDGQANQQVSIRLQRSDKVLSNAINMGFIGRVEYTCPKYSSIIYGSDGSEKDCSPYMCVTDNMGVYCSESCSHSGECNPQHIYACEVYELKASTGSGKCVKKP